MTTTTTQTPAQDAPAKRKPPTPKRLQKKALTLPEAADQYERTDDELQELAKAAKKIEADREEAAEVLLAHFARTGYGSYMQRIGWMWTVTRLILDQEKVTVFLAERLPEFQKRTQSKRKLTRLAAPDVAPPR